MVRLSVPKTWLVTALLAAGLFVAAPGMVRGQTNCTCRYAGQSYALDTCVCIVTPGGARMACCDRVLNNTSWTFTGGSCPIAAAPRADATQFIARLLRPTSPEGVRRDGWPRSASARE